MLLVRYGEDDAPDVGIREQRLHVRCGGDSQLLLECCPPLLRPAERGYDLQPVGRSGRPSQHLGPAAEADDRELYLFCSHQLDSTTVTTMLPAMCHELRRKSSA